ncbi:hypothetical protein FRC03_003305 [Tulasnella sp. 419]|nr:hypothetical protein FRC02_001561 [Tulasnella sp. 418]KAG8942324.1 hypothetical protein FRC03_003305 [Tulasnella sp. 419]
MEAQTDTSAIAPSRSSPDANDWSRSDKYHNSFLIKPDPALDHIKENAAKESIPDIAVTDAQGKFLHLLLRSMKAKKVLEVGTLAGFSTVYMAKALPADGELISCEIDERHAEVARQHIKNASLSCKVEVLVGPASDTLPNLIADGSFDFAFIDADKEGNLDYFKQAKRLIRTGGVIIVDNVVRKGNVANPEYSDSSVEGVRALLRYIKTDPEVEATTIATVGEKGYDGFLYAYKL